MGTDLAVYERALAPMVPTFRDLLGSQMDPARLIRTVMISMEKTPELQNCSMQSVLMSTTTFAVLALEVDGTTGQGYMLPFKGKAQPVIGYKGYNTLGDRAGIAIGAGVVREGDAFDYDEGTEPFIRHKRALLPDDRPIIAAWATATRPGKTPTVVVLPMSSILAVRAKSPGASRRDSPWNDEAIGFPAMAEKTARRRLARSMPLNLIQRAAVLEETFEERGRLAYLRPDGALITPGDSGAGDRIAPEAGDILPPDYVIDFPDGSAKTFPDLPAWERYWQHILSRTVGKPEGLRAYRQLNGPRFAELSAHHPDKMLGLAEAIGRQLGEIQ